MGEQSEASGGRDAPAAGSGSRPVAGRLGGVRWGIPDAALGVLLVIVGVSIWRSVVIRVVIDPVVQLLVDQLVVWVPLLVVAAVASYGRGRRSPAADFGLRFAWLDLLWGLGAGLLARGVAMILEALAGGGGGGVLFGIDTVPAWVLTVLVAPIVIAPFVEELFFRGLLLRAVQERLTERMSRSAPAIAVLVAAAVFALLHAVDAPSGIAPVVIGAFVLGIATGALAVLTGRIGGAILAHAVFNAAGLLMVLPR